METHLFSCRGGSALAAQASLEVDDHERERAEGGGGGEAFAGKGRELEGSRSQARTHSSRSGRSIRSNMEQPKNRAAAA